jgi:UDP:flavonoid glycosyltransferase YjiC (YdhE family)
MKILFANVPADGHFHPLTGLAMQLKKSGHDVRWYAGSAYADKLQQLDIPYYPFRSAQEITDKNLDTYFPKRKNIRSAVARLKFDLKYFFLAPVEGYFEDIRAINKEFPFHVLVSDQMFCAATLIKIRLAKLNVVIGVMPYAASSKSLPPAGLGYGTGQVMDCRS